MENNLYTDMLQICRTCMQEIIDTSFFYLDCVLSANTQLTIRQMLYRCIPELDLSIVPNAVICSRCVDNLLSVFDFKKNCLESEIQISKYIQQVQHTGDLNLVELVRFHQQDIKNLDIIEVKIEDLDITDNFKSEDLICETSTFNEVSECRESTEPKYLLELQKVEIEDVIFNTFDDISYNLSAAEENSDTHNSNITQNCLPEVIEHQTHNSNITQNCLPEVIEHQTHNSNITQNCLPEVIEHQTHNSNITQNCLPEVIEHQTHNSNITQNCLPEVIEHQTHNSNITQNCLPEVIEHQTHNSNITQNCLPEVIERQDNYSKNLNKTNAYYQCDRCGHKAESKFKLILHLKRHTRKNFCHEERRDNFQKTFKVKERSSTSVQIESSPQSDSNKPTQQISVTYLNQGQKIRCLPVVVVSSYRNVQPAASPSLSVTSQGSSSPCVTPAPTLALSSKTAITSPKTKSVKSATTPTTKASPIPQPQEDEHTTQRILDILAKYTKKLRNSPDLNNKPAPRRRSNPSTNPNQNAKRKKSSSSKKTGHCSNSLASAVTVSTSETNEASVSPKQLILTDSTPNQSRSLIIANSNVGEALKMSNTAVFVPGNYIMPVSMVKGGQLEKSSCVRRQ